MPQKISPTQQLAGHLLGTDVREWVRVRRSHPYRPSFEAIANELREATDGQVDVSREMIRRWSEDDAETAA